MTTFEFAHPHVLWLLLLLAPLGWWTFWRGARASAVQFSSLRLTGAIRPVLPAGWRLALLRAGRLAAVGLVIVGMARPRFGTVEREVTQEGVDIFYCLDISGSMRAEDFEPNRLEKAKELTAQFIANRRTDRQGLVVFSGESFMLCPLTFDGDTVRRFLDAVTFDDVGVQGTAIGMGLARALKKLEHGKAKSKVVILMTDGENNAGRIDPRQAAQVAKKMGVRVYTIGIGSRGIATVTVQTPLGPRRQRVRTSIDEWLLRHIAQETGGEYGRATNAKELEGLLDRIDDLEKSEIEMKEYRNFDERMAVFVWPALALILIDVLARTIWLVRIP